MMAAGCIVVAHDSAGPQMDIIVPTLSESELTGVGYLASDVQSFAECMKQALDLPSIQREEVIIGGRPANIYMYNQLPRCTSTYPGRRNS